MTAHLQALSIDAADPGRLAAFWGAVLEREVRGDLLPAAGPGDLAIRFRRSTETRRGLDRTHLDLTSDVPGGQAHVVELALSLGATYLDVGQGDDTTHVVLADPEGGELCVVEEGNRFLAGTGRVGALSGDGRRGTGVFWSEVLGWPLVWDEDDETAVQSPHGGPKITWGGAPVAPKHGHNRLRLDLVADGPLEEEVERLVGLGATRAGVADDPEGVALTDPDDNELQLLPGPG